MLLTMNHDDGARIRSLRESHGLSRRDLAEIIRVRGGETTIRLWEDDPSIAVPAWAVRLCELEFGEADPWVDEVTRVTQNPEKHVH